MSDYKIRGIPAAALPNLWHFAIPYIKRALDHTSGEITVDDFKQLCLDRAVQLWLISKEDRVVGAITTEIVNYPRRKHCRVITLGGSAFAEWMPVADKALDAWAKEQGCLAIETYARKGLVPKLATIGYRHKHSILVKELDHE